MSTLNLHTINPAVIVQSALALVTAISITDTIRECLVAMKPATHVQTAYFRIAATIVLLIFVTILIYYLSTNPEPQPSNPEHYNTNQPVSLKHDPYFKRVDYSNLQPVPQ